MSIPGQELRTSKGGEGKCPPKTELTPRQQRFVEEYLVDLNATQAAIRAGYSKKTAYSQGQRLLKHVEVERAVEEAKAERAEKTGLSADRVLRELAALSFSDVRQLYTDKGKLRPVSEWPDEVAAAVAGLETVHRNLTAGDSAVETILKVKRWDKPRALEMLCKHLGLFEEKVAHSGAIEIRWQESE